MGSILAYKMDRWCFIPALTYDLREYAYGTSAVVARGLIGARRCGDFRLISHSELTTYGGESDTEKRESVSIYYGCHFS